MGDLILFLGLILCPTSSDSIKEVDLLEMSTRVIISAATGHGKTMVASTSNIRSTDHFIFDHSNGQAFEIDDGRIGKSILSRLVTTRNGFAILGKIRLNIISLDENGDFLGSDNLTSFEGGDGAIHVVQVASFGLGKVLVTYFFDEFSQLGLAEVDLERKAFQPIHAQAPIKGYPDSYWAHVGDSFVFIVPETGEIQAVDKNFQIQRTIRGGQDPVPSPFARPAQAKYLSGFSPILSNPVFTENLIKFDLYDYKRDKSVKSIRLGVLDDRAFHIPPSKEFTVGETGGTALIFNKESGDYRVHGEPRP